MIRAVELDKRTDADINKPKMSSSRVKKHKRFVRNEYNNEDNPLLIAGFILLMLAAFIIIAIVKYTENSAI